MLYEERMQSKSKKIIIGKNIKRRLYIKYNRYIIILCQILKVIGIIVFYITNYYNLHSWSYNKEKANFFSFKTLNYLFRHIYSKNV